MGDCVELHVKSKTISYLDLQRTSACTKGDHDHINTPQVNISCMIFIFKNATNALSGFVLALKPGMA